MNMKAWPHGEIREIFPDIFLVTATNITQYQGVDLQHSRNMVIIREHDCLSLINTVQLSEDGLTTLETLGSVKNIIRIGAFHGRDDHFYKQRYGAKLWALKGMQHEGNITTDIELILDGQMPINDSSFFLFETSQHPEGIIHLNRENGIIITCDSIKNWVTADPFFSPETAALYQQLGFFGPASISAIWKQACQVDASDFARLKNYKFQHLLSAHGEPLLHNAHELVADSILKEYGI